MAETLTGFSITCKLLATLRASIDGGAKLPSVQEGITFAPPTFTTGTSANQADRIWGDTNRTLADAATENLDLYDLAAFDIGAGAGRDALGQLHTNVELCALLVINTSASAGNLLIGGEGSVASFQSIFHVSGAASDTAGFGPLKPNGVFFCLIPGDPAWVITDAANHLLKFAATGGAVTYSVAFMARSA